MRDVGSRKGGVRPPPGNKEAKGLIQWQPAFVQRNRQQLELGAWDCQARDTSLSASAGWQQKASLICIVSFKI